MGVTVREKVKGSNVWWVFINFRGKRTSRRVGSKEAAQEAARKIEAKLALDEPITRKRAAPTLTRYWEKYEKPYLRSSVRDTTRSIYTTAFESHILPVLGSKRLDAIKRLDIEWLISYLINTGYEVQEVRINQDGEREVVMGKRNFTKTTLAITLRCLTASLNRAIERGFLEKNPTKGTAKLFSQAGVRAEEIQPLSPREVTVFLNTVHEHYRRHYPLLLCAIHTGMRLSELSGLQWADVDFEGKFIMVRRQWVGRKLVPYPKTKKARRIDLSDALAAELKALRKRRKEAWLKEGKNEIPDFIFCTSKGKPMDASNIRNRIFYKTLEKAGLHRRRFHDLRHSFATLLLMQGESPAYVKDQLGHSSIKMTVDVYGHWIPGANRQAMNKLPTLGDESLEMKATENA